MSLTVRALDAAEVGQWDELVATSPQRTIFAERWWMDIVTGGGVALLGCFDKGRLVAGLPIWKVSTLRVTRLRQPPLTPYWGVLLHLPEGRESVSTSAEVKALTAFAEALAELPDITMQLHHSLGNWLPFYWNGFEQSTRYTYRLPDISDLQSTRKSLHEAVRRKLTRAERDGVATQDSVDPDLVARLSRSSMERQGALSSTDIPSLWGELAAEAGRRGRLSTNAVVDSEGNARAATAIVWDDRCAYNILVGSDSRFMDRSSGTLSTWRAIEQASSVVREFDFEGSMVMGVSMFYRTFGGELCPYFRVARRSSTRLNMARRLRGGE